MTLSDFFHLSLYGYLTQMFTPPEMPEGQIFSHLFYKEFAGADFPIVFRQKKGYGGNKLVDFLNIGSASFGPVSDRVIELLRDGGFTGWDTYPVEVYLKDGSKLDGYQGLMVTGGECDIDISLSEQVATIGPWPMGTAQTCLKELPIVLDSWDGSDFFRVKEAGGIYITRRLREAMKKARISNLDLNTSAADSYLACDSDGIFRIGIRGQTRPLIYPFPTDSPLRGFFSLHSGFRQSFGPRTQRDNSVGSHFFRLTRESIIIDPSVMNFFMGRSPFYVDDGSVFPTLVRRDIVSVLEGGHFTGWDATPAQVLFNNGYLSRDFFELHVSGRCPISPRVSVPVPVVWLNPKRKERSTGFKGFPLDFDGWDGSDIFLAGSTQHVFISARLRDALYKAIGRDHLLRNAIDCLITDIPPFGDLFPLLNDFHGLSTK